MRYQSSVNTLSRPRKSNVALYKAQRACRHIPGLLYVRVLRTPQRTPRLPQERILVPLRAARAGASSKAICNVQRHAKRDPEGLAHFARMQVDLRQGMHLVAAAMFHDVQDC